MDFIIRKAVYEDIPDIMEIMRCAYENMENPEWFFTDNEEYIRKHIEEHGFTMIAKTTSGQSAGFFLIKKPGLSLDNLGLLLDFTEEDLLKTVHMDMAAVHPDYQGHRLQSRMLTEAESILKDTPVCHYMATVHPDNPYSLNNMLKNGYEIKMTTLLYGGLPRHVLLKNKEIL